MRRKKKKNIDWNRNSRRKRRDRSNWDERTVDVDFLFDSTEKRWTSSSLNRRHSRRERRTSVNEDESRDSNELFLWNDRWRWDRQEKIMWFPLLLEFQDRRSMLLRRKRKVSSISFSRTRLSAETKDEIRSSLLLQSDEQRKENVRLNSTTNFFVWSSASQSLRRFSVRFEIDLCPRWRQTRQLPRWANLTHRDGRHWRRQFRHQLFSFLSRISSVFLVVSQLDDFPRLNQRENSKFSWKAALTPFGPMNREFVVTFYFCQLPKKKKKRWNESRTKTIWLSLKIRLNFHRRSFDPMNSDCREIWCQVGRVFESNRIAVAFLEAKTV